MVLNKNTMEDPTFKKKFLDWDWLPKNKMKREMAKKARQAKAIQKREEKEKEYDAIIQGGTPSTSTPNGRGQGHSRSFRGTRSSRGSRGKGSNVRGSHSGGSKAGAFQDDEDSSNGDDEESGDDGDFDDVSSQVLDEGKVGDNSQETSNESISNISGGSSGRKRSQPEANVVQKKQAKK